MNTNESQIFTSTGDLGTSRRQDERLYHNAETAYEKAADVAEVYQDLSKEADLQKDISRIVFRGIVSDSAFQDIRESELGIQLEVAMPLAEYGQDGWLIYLACNNGRRSNPLKAIPEMISATSSVPEPRAAANEVVDYRSAIDNAILPQLHILWSETFGWSLEEVTALREKMETQGTDKRSLWFSGLVLNNGVLTSAAMAERLDLPGFSGNLTLIESTEWRSLEDKGLMPTTLRYLNQQIATDTADYSQPPLVYAECNFTSRSDRAGYRSGFRIPSRDYAAQILVQNVAVGDNILEKGLRDFTFMYLPVHILEDLR